MGERLYEMLYITSLYVFPLFLTYAFSCQGPTMLLKLLDYLDLSS